MTQQDVVLVHGTFCNGGNWGSFATALEQRGFRVHTPTQRHHGNPRDVDVWSNAQKIGKLGLGDYVDDLRRLVANMETPPIIIGHSVGGLLAQLLGARVPNRGMVLLATAPAWGFWRVDLAPALLWGRYLPQWLGGQPMYPMAKWVWDRYICNTLPRDISDPFYDTLCAESGTVYRQMVLWHFDPKRQAKVDYSASDSPVLIVAGGQDKCTTPRVNRLTARKYGARATYVEIPDSDHMVAAGPAMSHTLDAIDRWVDLHGLNVAAPCR